MVGPSSIEVAPYTHWQSNFEGVVQPTSQDSPALRRCLSWVALVISAVLGLVVTLSGATHAEGADRYGIGGSSTFPAGTEFVLAPGQTLPPTQSLTIENIGNTTAEVSFTSNAPEGIVVASKPESARLAPGEQVEFPFTIEVLPGTAAGNYRVVVEGKQTNVSTEGKSGVVFAPAFGAQLVVVVDGARAEAIIRAVDTNTGKPLRGRLIVSAPGKTKGTRVTIRQQTGTELDAVLAPGSYIAGFTIPGFLDAEQPFTLAEGDRKVVEVKVTGVSFAEAAVLTRGSDLTSVELVATVLNQVRRVRGPVAASVVVLRDGQQIDDVLLQQLPALPTGPSSFRQQYTPADGFTPGLYQFQFRLTTPNFTVDAAEVPEIDVPRPIPWLWIALALLVIGGIVYLVLRRRRHDRVDADATTGEPVPVAPVSAPAPRPEPPVAPPTTPPVAPPPAGQPQGGVPPIAPPSSGPPQQPPPPTGPPHA